MECELGCGYFGLWSLCLSGGWVVVEVGVGVVGVMRVECVVLGVVCCVYIVSGIVLVIVVLCN